MGMLRTETVHFVLTKCCARYELRSTRASTLHQALPLCVQKVSNTICYVAQSCLCVN